MSRAAPGAPSDPAAVSDEALLAAARAREAWASDALIMRHLRMMNGLAFRLVGPTDLDDVVQESVFLALRALPTLRHAEGLSSWFASVVVSVARKVVRRRRLLARLGFVDASVVDWERVIAADAPPDVTVELKAIYRIVERLRSPAREAFILRRVEHRQLQEIADILRASLASVKRWVSASEAELARLLAEREGTP